MEVLKVKGGEKLLLNVRETITFSGYLGMLTDFRMFQAGDGNFIKSGLTEPDSGAEKEPGSN